MAFVPFLIYSKPEKGREDTEKNRDRKHMCKEIQPQRKKVQLAALKGLSLPPPDCLSLFFWFFWCDMKWGQQGEKNRGHDANIAHQACLVSHSEFPSLYLTFSKRKSLKQVRICTCYFHHPIICSVQPLWWLSVFVRQHQLFLHCWTKWN